AAAESEEWHRLQETLDRSRAVRYAIDVRLRMNDVVEHPVFGLGVVKGLPGPNKAEVLFEAGKKLLRCG
ncbi:MAG TPA: hypothetical protein VNX25_03990, partial [Verrucomicrobiae bacterium]|nr:hypothetical protein [Verrucomicrobiae bacterium]